MEMPIMVIKGCQKHCTCYPSAASRRGLESGPESSQANRDWIYDCITCWQCWDLDEPAMLRACAAFHMAPEIIVEVRNKVMRNKLADNRN